MAKFQAACLAKETPFAGKEYKQECWCGLNPPPGSRSHSGSNILCSFSCTNDTTQACGGNRGYVSIYYDTSKYTPTSATYDPIAGATQSIIQSIGTTATWVAAQKPPLEEL